jgi:hypothetical protein
MTEIEIVKLVLRLLEEYGPDVVQLVSEVARSLTPTEAVTFCSQKMPNGMQCGQKCPVYILKVNGKDVFRGKCPIHGFERSL